MREPSDVSDVGRVVEEVASAVVQTERTASYTAELQKDPAAPEYWLVELQDEPRVHSFGRTLAEATRRIAAGTRLWYGIPDDHELRLEFVFNDSTVDDNLRRVETLRLLLDEVRRQFHEAIQETSRLLTSELDLSRRDTAAVLHISHQRVHQLLDKRARSAERAELHG